MRALAMLICVAFLQLLYQPAFSQCKAAPPLESCVGNEATVSDNETILLGIKKWHYGAPATFNQLTLRGGTLIVCTELTINVLNMDSGTIVIRPGAKLTAGGGGSGMIWRGNCAVYNYGRFEITTNLSFEGPYATASKPNILMNVTASASSRSFNYLVINNPYSWYINNGLAEFGGIITDNSSVAGSVCLGKGSQVKQNVLINKVKDAYSVPYGMACVSVYSYSQLLDTLTNDPKLLICLSNSHSSATGGTNKPNGWGVPTAHVFSSCNSCADVALLPAEESSSRPRLVRENSPAMISLFPNPFSDIVQIKWTAGKKPNSVMILDNIGRIVHHENLEQVVAGSHSISLATLPAGSYMARIMYPGSVIVQKLIKTGK
ncbi:MAG: T9SS type A sorting domain-containing protein [Niastella sp.]|nr:T9SS type A sorting domain-containing protein [Niastella sp.]